MRTKDACKRTSRVAKVTLLSEPAERLMGGQFSGDKNMGLVCLMIVLPVDLGTVP